MRHATPKRVFLALSLVLVLIVVLIVVHAPAPQAATPTGQFATPIVRAAFYYPWYPNAWNQSGVDPFSQYQPSAGYYSSADPAIVKQQIAAMQYGNLDAGIISWWGQGSQEDSVVPTDLAAAGGTGFKWALYYEPESYGNPSVGQIQSDLSYIKLRFASSPNYLTIEGKPVIFVYAGPSDGCGMAQRWSQANATEGFYTVLKVFAGYTSCATDASSWHQYAPSSAEDHQVGYSFSISPGFYKSGESAPRLARNLSTWARNVRDTVASNEPLQLITTFSEWGEGTAVESGTDWASPSGYGSYLDVMHNLIPPLATQPAQGSVTEMATAGTYVRADVARANYDGTNPLLASSQSYRSLLQFAPVLPAGATAISASLTIEPLVTTSGSFTVSAEGALDPTTVTWDSQPPRTGVPLGTSTSPVAHVPLAIPLTGLSISSTTGLAVTFTTRGVIERFTGAGTANAPVLTVVYSTG